MRGHMTGHNNKCDKCAENFKTVSQLRMHMKEEHNSAFSHVKRIKCERCVFTATTNSILEKHLKEEHGIQETPCRFWAKGRCTRGLLCKFSHKKAQRKNTKDIDCKYQKDCSFLPRCKFAHRDVKPCFYQENCQNSYCKFYHFSSTEDNFLGYPSLKTRKITSEQTQKPPVWMWRPW